MHFRGFPFPASDFVKLRQNRCSEILLCQPVSFSTFLHFLLISTCISPFSAYCGVDNFVLNFLKFSLYFFYLVHPDHFLFLFSARPEFNFFRIMRKKSLLALFFCKLCPARKDAQGLLRCVRLFLPQHWCSHLPQQQEMALAQTRPGSHVHPERAAFPSSRCIKGRPEPERRQ